jgi:Helix-turn-helix domain
VVDRKASFTQPDEAVIDRDQIRMARAGLGWSAKELARRARLSIATIRRAEAGRLPGVTEGNVLLIQHTFEDARRRLSRRGSVEPRWRPWPQAASVVMMTLRINDRLAFGLLPSRNAGLP